MRDMIRLGQVDAVRKRIAEATQTLLGDTIVLSDADWLEPTELPGWTRAHLAHHLARSADAMRQVVLAAVEGHRRPLYLSEGRRRADIDRGPARSGLDLQIDLDTTAGGLDEAFGLVTDWLTPITLPVGEVPLAGIVVARLHEVVLHHLDLGTSFTAAQVDPVVASWLVQWAALWVRTRPGNASFVLTSDSGVTERVGDSGDARVVTGSDVALWTWLTGRSDGAGVHGADGHVWPLLG